MVSLIFHTQYLQKVHLQIVDVKSLVRNFFWLVASMTSRANNIIRNMINNLFAVILPVKEPFSHSKHQIFTVRDINLAQKV